MWLSLVLQVQFINKGNTGYQEPESKIAKKQIRFKLNLYFERHFRTLEE